MTVGCEGMAALEGGVTVLGGETEILVWLAVHDEVTGSSWCYVWQ